MATKKSGRAGIAKKLLVIQKRRKAVKKRIDTLERQADQLDKKLTKYLQDVVACV